ncbi:MAG: TldD/PmbA family protein [Phormidium sp. GEM2.Bin31]|nr:TldD/PmbA family protein [Phormidium sp. BM_Day4_Bin.17]TVR10419.1 MAG: TldD/PmbA family protein [Phormidium sp. GEM2.Bin31]UCJ12748.1 MAG: TldD/PmbA family protein [Phormidium sp. PBR-2020]
MANPLADLQNQISDTLKRYQHRVDYLAIRLEASEGTDIFIRGIQKESHADHQIETLSEDVSLGGQVRACYKGGWGFSSFNRLSQLGDRVEEAVAAARLVGCEQTELAPIPILSDICQLPLTRTDPRQIDLKDKKDLCDRYIEQLLSVSPRIATTSVRYSDCAKRLLIATSEGSFIDQSWVDLEMRFAATARDGETVQTGRETSGSRRGYDDMTALDKQVKSAAERAVEALELPCVRGGTYPVVIDPILSGLFVHEAFGHLSEADMAYENPDLLEVMTLGRRFGGEDLQIFDGAAPQGHRGSYFYDDEATPATTTQLIENGVLVGRLHSRETAGRLGEAATGNARCLDYQHSPIVRMTNTWIGRGTTPVDQLCAGIEEGVYARNWLGGMTNGEMFTFSAGEAWMIRNGKLAEKVRDVTLSGNVFQTLADIEAIGDDFYWDESGGCGKGGQNGLPVGCGGPSLRINNVVVGGEA